MYELNLIILKSMVDNPKYNNMEHRKLWVFDDYENFGFGCTGQCSECIPNEDYDYMDIPF